MVQKAKSTEPRPASRAGKQKSGLPAWAGVEKGEIEGLVVKLAREGKPSAVVGMILRDQYAVPSVKAATGKTVTEILQGAGLTTELPEDMVNLMKRAVGLRSHLATHPKDRHNARGLQLIESRIRKLAFYYKRQGRVPADWKYSSAQAKIVVD
ncbi:MAG TPA: 30S ribosomal protein S15 [Candidatus Thermoplasmatota archaeon]|nr:30S ribosomal protein S15 [Candidatus Thermoplasmatota archaeon]